MRKRNEKDAVCCSRRRGIVLVAILMALWLLAIAFSVTIIDNQLNDASNYGGLSFLTAQIVDASTPLIQNTAHDAIGNSTLPNYPIDHRNIVSSNQLSPEVVSQCHRALWHTLETTTIVLQNQETFIITGDIKDMWLRDSAAQIHPLLLPNVYEEKSLVQLDPRLERLVSGLILKTAKLIRHDPYANAFSSVIKNRTKFEKIALGRHGYVATRNYELDSGCYFMRMLYYFYQSFPDHTILKKKEVKEAVHIMVDLWIAEQRHELDAFPSGELFDCFECRRSYWYNPNQMPRDGKGTKTNHTAGLTWSGFRPSDETCVYGYLIPANMFTVVVLDYMLQISRNLWKNSILNRKMTKLRNEIQYGIDRYGIIHHDRYGDIYAYEVDGFGNYILMDDANVPSLLSIPYLRYSYNKTVYDNTVQFIYSTDNPSYHKGWNEWTGEIEGIGSSHAHKKWEVIPSDVWPMSIIMKGLVSDNATEKIRLVHQLLQASASTGWMHESFDVNNPFNFSRPWFCWPDSLFAELVMSLTRECPQPSEGQYTIMEWLDSELLPGSVFARDE